VEKTYTQLREFILPTIAKLDGGTGGTGDPDQVEAVALVQWRG